MHQLVLYPADIHSAGYNQYFGLTHKRALLRFDLQHINKSIIRLHLIRTGKAIHQHFQPTGLIFFRAVQLADLPYLSPPLFGRAVKLQ